MLNIYHWITVNTLDDVRWEKVEQIKLNLNVGTDPAPPERVAEKLVEHMLTLDAVNHWWKRGGAGSETNCVVGGATSAARQSDTGGSKLNRRNQASGGKVKGKLTRSGTLSVHTC